MAEDIESPASKKHRIIHWNPDAGREQAARRWTWKRILAWTVGGFFGLLIAAGIVIRVAKLVLGPDIFKPRSEMAAASSADTNSLYVSQAKADQAHEMVAKQLLDLRRMPMEHPVLFQRLVLLTKSFDEGESLLASHDFARAYLVFDGLGKDIAIFTRDVTFKNEARQAYDTVLLRVKDLELARSLAPGSLEEALELAGTGRQSLNDGNFTGAKQSFDRANADLKKAQTALDDYVRENLVKGAQALTKGEKVAAKKAFQAALDKSPGNETAAKGMARAENIDRVYALLQLGEKLEKQAQYAEAADAYGKAFALDSMSAVAQQGQSRAATLEKETKFAAAASAADAAFKRRDWAKAGSEAEAALKIYPKKTEMQTLLKSSKENAHKDAVQKELAKGFAYENAHQWKEARDAYYATMQLEPDQQDAKEGYLRSGTVIRALLEYEKRIEVAEQLANKAEFQAAMRRFNEAMAVKPTYLESTDRVQQLRALLLSQSQPVDVTFKGDGKTWVSISGYPNGLLGQIEAQTVKILPGDYEIIGRRKGYKDVNMLLQVRKGTTPPVVTVSCTDSSRG